ncbi:hypothetical protein LCY76_23520 [Fictibacillus sp. KIGAM418]|uniref:Uncharacterized protein n=1 Tax=Fictibacillus marinisediminis TaxID=2878389 RepID=A0A9X2BHR5_9BACL|nr:hypothetical protein [Fictibacillus marinisediminis]MCK6259542.1 hypothetical protein [Fictibacillus marinisediminis]
MIIEKKNLNQEEFALYLEVQRELTNIFNEDKEFIKEYNHSYNFYKQKFYKTIKEKPDRDQFSEKFYNYSTDLFFQGFYIAKTALQDPTAIFPDQFFMQTEGILKEQTFSIINGYTSNELLQIVSHGETAEFETWLLVQYSSVEKVLFQTKKDIVTYGAYKFILEERAKRNLKPKADKNKVGIISRTDDCLFLDPDKYISCIAAHDKGEVWEINYWSTYETKRQIGEINVISLSKEEVEISINKLPFYMENENTKVTRGQIILTANLTKEIADHEVRILVENLYNMMKDRHGDKVDIQIKLARIEETLHYQPI